MPNFTKNSVRRIGALLCSAALAAAVLTACGGDSPTDGDAVAQSSTPTSTQQSVGESVEKPADSAEKPADSADKPAESEGSSRDGLPKGYPENVPLPAFTTAHKVGGSAGDGFWVVLIELKESTDTPVEDYAAQLEAAGYTVEDGSGGKEATGPQWDISFHSSMEGTLTISVI